MTDGPTLSVLVVTYRRQDLLAACLDSVTAALDRLGEPSELVVVDNGSRDGTAALVGERYPSARLVVVEENDGFTPAFTRGLSASSGTWIANLNDDTTVEPDCFAALLATARGAPDVGAVGAQMRFAGNRNLINSAGIEVDRLGVASDRLLAKPAEASESEPTEVFGVCGGAALYRRAMLEELGGYDQSFFAYLEDVDLAWRARMRGWRSLYCPAALVYHHHSATLKHGSPFKYRLVGRNRVRMLAKNATTAQLLRHGPAMVAYDLAYIAYVRVLDGTWAPLLGRLEGLREWRRYRRLGAPVRRRVRLARSGGLRAALRRRRGWEAGKVPHLS